MRVAMIAMTARTVPERPNVRARVSLVETEKLMRWDGELFGE